MEISILVVACIVIGLIYMVAGTNFIRISYHNISKKRPMNLTVVHLSDIHGRTRFINGSISKMVNQFRPDYVLVTGDLASKKNQLAHVIEEIGKIKCENIIFVPGNYERQTTTGLRKREYSEEEYKSLVYTLRNSGITFLENGSIQTEVNGRQLLIYGFDNSIYGNEQLNTNVDEFQDYDYVILLAHSPSIIQFIERNKLSYDLLLVGHTHGGQVRLFGQTFGVYKHFHVGLKLIDEMRHFYINRGLGTVKLPVRLACPPEIAVFKI